MNDFKVKLRIKDAYKEDAGRDIVRIDLDILKELDLRTGDVLEIYHPVSNKKTGDIIVFHEKIFKYYFLFNNLSNKIN